MREDWDGEYSVCLGLLKILIKNHYRFQKTKLVTMVHVVSASYVSDYSFLT